MTTIDHRGRDLVIIPNEEMLRLPTPQLLQALFGAHLPADIRAAMGRDKRHAFLRTQPLHFQAVKRALQAQCTPFSIAFEERPALPFATTLQVEPRPYQNEALANWLAAGSAGVVVLPTGAGKTLVAAMAIHETGLWTLVVVPTLDLLQQWRTALASALSLGTGEIGIFGGGEKETKPITIITYDSAAVYRRSPAELTEGRYLAQYQEFCIDIALSSEDEARYAEQRRIYRSFLQRRHIVIHSPEEFQQKIIFLSARDPEAREAMLAWREARNIAMNAPAKYVEIERLLRLHSTDQVILFSEYNQVVDEISRRFCLPSITYKTPAEERRAILERFRSGQYTKLVTGRVLNEGVDVPDCRVAIIVSGNSTKREYIQRLGRVLRPKAGQALLYELVTSSTTEEEMAKRRK